MIHALLLSLLSLFSKLFIVFFSPGDQAQPDIKWYKTQLERTFSILILADASSQEEFYRGVQMFPKYVMAYAKG